MRFMLHDHQLIGRMMRLLLFAAVVFVLSGSTYSQTDKPVTKPPSDPMSKDDSKDDPRFGSPEAEMRSKLAIKDEKKKYDEHVARAKEVSQLASQVSASYESHNGFSSDDEKRLQRMEKLIKRIRNDSGGSESSAGADIKDIPAGMEDTIKKVSAMADELKKLVENTPRNVVSAA